MTKPTKTTKPARTLPVVDLATVAGGRDTFREPGKLDFPNVSQ